MVRQRKVIGKLGSSSVRVVIERSERFVLSTGFSTKEAGLCYPSSASCSHTTAVLFKLPFFHWPKRPCFQLQTDVRNPQILSPWVSKAILFSTKSYGSLWLTYFRGWSISSWVQLTPFLQRTNVLNPLLPQAKMYIHAWDLPSGLR